LGAKLRPGNVHSAEDWEELLPPEIERQQKLGKQVVLRARCVYTDLAGDNHEDRRLHSAENNFISVN
jgi:hypothetical protein